MSVEEAEGEGDKEKFVVTSPTFNWKHERKEESVRAVGLAKSAFLDVALLFGTMALPQPSTCNSNDPTAVTVATPNEA